MKYNFFFVPIGLDLLNNITFGGIIISDDKWNKKYKKIYKKKHNLEISFYFLGGFITKVKPAAINDITPIIMKRTA